MRVLLIGDEASLQAQLRARLESRGYRVDSTGDCKDGLYLATEYPFDAAIIDFGQPGLSSLAATLEIRPLAERIMASLNKVYRDKAISVEMHVDKAPGFRGD